VAKVCTLNITCTDGTQASSVNADIVACLATKQVLSGGTVVTDGNNVTTAPDFGNITDARAFQAYVTGLNAAFPGIAYGCGWDSDTQIMVA